MSPVAATWPEGLAAGRNEAFPSVCGRSSGQCGVCVVCRECRSEGFVAPSGLCASRKGTGSRLLGNRKASRIGSRFVREPQGLENWLSFCSGTARLRELALVLFENWKASRIGSRFIRELESMGGFRLFRFCGAGCERRSVGIATRGGLQGASSARCLPTAIGEVRQKTPGRRRGGPCRLTPFDQFRNGVLKPG